MSTTEFRSALKKLQIESTFKEAQQSPASMCKRIYGEMFMDAAWELASHPSPLRRKLLMVALNGLNDLLSEMESNQRRRK